jgi:hypothetical protein
MDARWLFQCVSAYCDLRSSRKPTAGAHCSMPRTIWPDGEALRTEKNTCPYRNASKGQRVAARWFPTISIPFKYTEFGAKESRWRTTGPADLAAPLRHKPFPTGMSGPAESTCPTRAERPEFLALVCKYAGCDRAQSLEGLMYERLAATPVRPTATERTNIPLVIEQSRETAAYRYTT